MLRTTDRRDIVIETIVTTYLETGEPVSSGTVGIRSGLGLSSATIRNLMKELEDDGYLKQPHTSAGRVPTIKCYRYYVRYLVTEVEPEEKDSTAISSIVRQVLAEYDAEEFMEHVAGILSEVTDLIGIAMTPSFDEGRFDKLEIINLSGPRYLVILSLNSGLVKTINLMVNKVIPRTTVEDTARLLTQRLHGLTVRQIRETINERLRDISRGNRTLIDVIIDRSHAIFTFRADRQVHMAGLSRIMLHPDMSEPDAAPSLANLFENKEEIALELQSLVDSANDVTIRIGGMGIFHTTTPLSMVSASFHGLNADGVLAVIGPPRIPYPRLSAIVRYAAQLTSNCFTRA